MKTSATNRRLRMLLTAIANETLIPRPEFQRRLVWSNRDKVAFIQTVIEGYPFPEIYIAAGEIDPATGEGTEMLVDGQQRMTTLYQYFKGSDDLRLPRELSPYIDLAREDQIAFLEYEVVIRDLGNKPVHVIKEIFQRINSTSYGLNAMEIHNARYGGQFKEFAERLAQHEFFEEVRFFSASDIRRMNDVRYSLGLIITLLGTYFNRDSELETYLNRYNEDFPQETDVAKEFTTVIDEIRKFELPRTSRAYKKADFFTLFVEVHRVLFKQHSKIDHSNTSKKLSEFYNQCDEASEGRVPEGNEAFQYYRATLQASNDRSSRITRGKAIANVIVTK